MLVVKLKKIMNELVEKLENVFREVSYDAKIEEIEICDWTSGGYNIIVTLREPSIEGAIQSVKDLDPNHEVEIWWWNDAFRANYNESMKEAIDDINEWKRSVLSSLYKELPMRKSVSVSIVVNIDVSYPDTFSSSDVISEVVSGFTYGVDIPDTMDVSIDSLEINDVYKVIL